MPAEPFPDEPHEVLHRVVHAPDLPVSHPNPIVDGDLEEAQADAERLDLNLLGEGHAYVDEPHLGEGGPPEGPHARLGIADGSPKAEVESRVQDSGPDQVEAA